MATAEEIAAMKARLDADAKRREQVHAESAARVAAAKRRGEL